MSVTKKQIGRRDSDEWLRAICSTIGGSSAADACGQGRYRTRRELFVSMSRARSGEPIARLPQNGDMRRGVLFESVALDLMRERLGVKSGRPHEQSIAFYNDEYPWAHHLPDEVYDADSFAEVKVPRPGTIARIMSKGLLTAWVIQALHGCAVMRAKRCLFGLLDPITTELFVYEIARDDHYIDRIMSAERELAACVDSGRIPTYEDEIDDDEQDPESHAIEERIDDPIVAGTLRRMLRLRDILKEADAEYQAAADELKAALTAIELDRVVIDGVGHVSELTGKRYDSARVYFRKGKAPSILDRDAVLAAFPEIEADKDKEPTKRRFWKLGEPRRPLLIYPAR